MKTQQNKTKRRIIKGALLILGVCLAIPLCLGMYSGYSSHLGTTKAIEKALEDECNCKTVDFDHSAYGLQFSAKDGVTGNKVSYILKDCKEITTALQETQLFNKIFLEEIEGYAKIDVIDFQFEKEEAREVVTVKKGIIQ